MRKMRWLTGLGVMAVTTLLACGEDDPAGPQEERFTATLSGENEVPPVTTEATGTATFTIRGDSLFYELTVSNITGVTASHIHGPADPGVNAGVLLLLYSSSQGPTGAINGTLAAGKATASDVNGISIDSLFTLLRNGKAYVNVHTAAHAPGEIRGQITRAN